MTAEESVPPLDPFPNAMAEQNDTNADNHAAPDGAISQALRSLAEYKEQHLQLLAEILAADGANLFHVDLVVMAAMHRSLALIDGFTTLVEQRNALAAIPLIRMQIDSIIRTYACWTVEKPGTAADRRVPVSSSGRALPVDPSSLPPNFRLRAPQRTPHHCPDAHW